MRALVYIRMPEGSVDERGFAVLKLIRASRPVAKRMSLAPFRTIIRNSILLSVSTRIARSTPCRRC